MQNTYTAVIKEDGRWWIGWIEEVPGVNCQETTHDELMKTLKITLKEALELNRQEALKAAKSNFSEKEQGIRGGIMLALTKDLLFQDIPKSTIFW